MYHKEEVKAATLQYFNGDELATKVWIEKYCLKHNGKFLERSPEDMHHRLAKEFARIEQKYPNPMGEAEIYELLKDFKYIVPQGGSLAGVGNNFSNMSLSNCFVIGKHVDSYGGILRADEELAQVMKRRGGAGHDISHIRPSGAIANGKPLGENAGTSLYMERFSNTTKEVQQCGRRGALMLSIDIKHPDAEKFVDRKMTSGAVTGANVSVKISDEFMNAIKKGQDYFYQTFPIELNSKQTDAMFSFEESDFNGLIEENRLYPLIDGAYAKKINPQKLWAKIVHNAWKSAEPGILFWDKILRESPAAGYGEIWKEISTNPCGELPLSQRDSCRLFAINLYNYVINKFSKDSKFNLKLFKEHVKKAMRLMDDLVDLEIEKIDNILKSINNKPHEKIYQAVERDLWENIKKSAVEGRRTGLGILGEADLLAGLGYRYGTPEATEFSENLHKVMATAAYESSIELAKERGAFPVWKVDDVEKSGFLKRMFSPTENNLLSPQILSAYQKYGRRNIGLLTIAPTGSIAIEAQVSSGIEPIFSPYYFRKKKALTDKVDYVDENGEKWEEFVVFHKPFLEWYAINSQLSFEKAKETLEKASKEMLQKVFEVSPYYKATAQDIDYLEKVNMQGVVQKWVDHSISVTVNMPEKVSEKMVSDVYQKAWEAGCKGMTVYRENSRGNVLSTSSSQKKEEFKYTSAVKRPKTVKCDVMFRRFRGEEFIFFIGLLDEKPYEVFGVPYNEETKISKSVKSGTLTRVKRGHYRFETDFGKDNNIENLLAHMNENEQNETRSTSAMLRHGMHPKHISKIISKYATISSFEKVLEIVLRSYSGEEEKEEKCPMCGGKIVKTEGCMKCVDCGYSKCG